MSCFFKYYKTDKPLFDTKYKQEKENKILRIQIKNKELEGMEEKLTQ